jgi:hypothetical protein
MYKLQVARVKLSNLISKFEFINTNQMSIHLFPVMHLYALHHVLFKGNQLYSWTAVIGKWL